MQATRRVVALLGLLAIGAGARAQEPPPVPPALPPAAMPKIAGPVMMDAGGWSGPVVSQGPVCGGCGSDDPFCYSVPMHPWAGVSNGYDNQRIQVLRRMGDNYRRKQGAVFLGDSWLQRYQGGGMAVPGVSGFGF